MIDTIDFEGNGVRYGQQRRVQRMGLSKEIEPLRWALPPKLVMQRVLIEVLSTRLRCLRSLVAESKAVSV